MNSYINKETGAPVQAVQFEGNLLPDFNLRQWPDENGLQPEDMSWGYIETHAGRKHIHIGDWITRGYGVTLLYRNGDFQSQFEPVWKLPKREYATLTTANIDEARLRQIVAEEVEKALQQRLTWLRTGALAHPGYDDLYEVK